MLQCSNNELIFLGEGFVMRYLGHQPIVRGIEKDLGQATHSYHLFPALISRTKTYIVRQEYLRNDAENQGLRHGSRAIDNRRFLVLT